MQVLAMWRVADYLVKTTRFSTALSLEPSLEAPLDEDYDYISSIQANSCITRLTAAAIPCVRLAAISIAVVLPAVQRPEKQS